MSSCASPISADRHSITAGKSYVSSGRPTGSTGRPVSASRPSSSADRTPVPAGRILGKFTTSASSERFPRAFNMELLDIHDGLKIFDCPKFGIFTSSSYDEEFAGPDANNLEHSLDVQEPTTVAQALVDLDWVEAIGTKWILKNKRDARGIVCKNKARLVAQGYRQEEGIDYSDVFAPVAIIEAIRLFLAFASFMGFRVYQMDVNSASLYEKIAEEVYVTQPRAFEYLDHLKKVYKVVKALYGLHQAPRAWYERLSTFLLKHRYRRGTIDKTLFIKKDSKDIMLVQVYVDDIIFGSTRKDWCEEFETLMQSEFEMNNSKLACTPFEPQKIREKNGLDEPINVHLYRSMIGCLMYLTATRPDIMFVVCAAARHQVTPKTSNLLSVKQIFKYLTAYPKKSTTGGFQFLGRRLISWQCKKQTIVATSSCEAEYVAAASCCGQCSAGRVTFCWLFPIPAGDLVSAGHMLFLLAMYFSCWYMTVTAGDLT
nr:hypothetical protein [Tanacetum cinerariifolium]